VSVVKSLFARDDLNPNIVASNWSGDHALAYTAICGEIEIVGAGTYDRTRIRLKVISVDSNVPLLDL
jgi:hypothetical protein